VFVSDRRPKPAVERSGAAGEFRRESGHCAAARCGGKVEAVVEDLQQKQREFRAALVRLERRPVYRRLGCAVSGAVLAGQAALLGLSLQRPVGWLPPDLCFRGASTPATTGRTTSPTPS
jgi:hypothetical protein